MPVGSFTLYSEALEALLSASLGTLAAGPVSALLLGAGYTPDAEAHATLADLGANELSGGDYARVQLASLALTDIAGGVRFSSGNAQFTANGTITDAKYFVLVMGTAGSLAAGDRLLGYVDLDNTNGAATVSSLNAEFSVQTPASGWFEMVRQ